MTQADREPGEVAGRRGGARWLVGAFALLCFAVSLSETMRFSIRGLDRFEVRTPGVDLNLVPLVLGRLAPLREARSGSGATRLVFLGDSITLSTGAGNPSLDEALDEALAARAGDVFEVHSLAALGAGPFDYYFLVDHVAAARPDGVVFAFSLQSLGDSFRSLSREGLSGWIAPRRLLDVARAPTHWIGLTADELLLHVAVVQLGGSELWRRLLVQQARLGVARRDASEWLGERFGDSGPQAFELARFAAARARARVPGRDRYLAQAEGAHYGAVFGAELREGHPILVVLGQTLRALREAGVPVLVVVNPVNVEHLRSLGLDADARLAHSLGALERVVRGAGAELLDLHALLPDAAFRDAAGHFGTESHPEAAERVAAALAPAAATLVARPLPSDDEREPRGSDVRPRAAVHPGG